MEEDKKGKTRLPLIISGVVVAALLCCYFFIPSVNSEVKEGYDILTGNNRQRTAQWVSQFGWWGPVIIIFSMMVQMFLLVIPSMLLILIAELAYGPVWGSLVSYAAVASAASFGYVLGRNIGHAGVDRLIGHKASEKVGGYIEKYGLWTVAVVRMSPFLSSDAISFAGGLLKMNYWKFIGATLLGISPIIWLIAFLSQDFDRLKKGLIWASAISIALLAVYIVYDKKRKKSRHSSHSGQI